MIPRYDDPTVIRETAKSLTGRSIASLCIPYFDSGSEEAVEESIDVDGAVQKAMSIHSDLKVQLDNGDEWVFLCPHDALDCIAIVPRELEGQYWNSDPDYKLNWTRIPDLAGSVMQGPIARVYELVPVSARLSHKPHVAGVLLAGNEWALAVRDGTDSPAAFFIASGFCDPSNLSVWQNEYEIRVI